MMASLPHDLRVSPRSVLQAFRRLNLRDRSGTVASALNAAPRPGLPVVLTAGAVMSLLGAPIVFFSGAPQGDDVRSELALERTATVQAQARDKAPPVVSPMVFADIDPGTARDLNARIPFVALGTDQAQFFRVPPGSEDFARALDCLASAVLYEAGDDPVGQAAVAQVVLNRVRHPAFPSSVCAVVYQGSERPSGCQFTFTCDGALRRIPSPPAWARARTTAAAFLNGQTDPSVGMATHYHTEGVHPYWSPSLDKIARVGNHLFFRWKGGWGRKSAFTSSYAAAEPRERKLTGLSTAHREPDALQAASGESARGPAPDPSTTISSGFLLPRAGDHFILVNGGGDGSELALQGLERCSGESYCKVIGWDRRSQDYGSPEKPVIRTVAFLYVTDKRTGVEMVLWDCTRFNRPVDSQCLSDRNRRWISFHGDLSRAS